MVDVFPVTQVLSTIPTYTPLATEREQSLKETEMKMKYN